jgi:polar amino acid transport system substrate-binding protein
MKKIFILLFLISITSYSATYSKVYNVVIHKEWKPYYYIDKNHNPNGYAVDLFKEVAKESNIQYKYIIVDNWMEGQKLIKEGKADIIPNLGITKKRSQTYLYTQATDTFSISLFKRKNSIDLSSYKDIQSRPIGIVEGNACNRIIKKKGSSLNIKKYTEFNLALYSLISGEIDTLCYPKPLLDFKLKELNLNDTIIEFGIPIYEVKRGIGFSHDNFELLTTFDDAITELKINGKYQKIYSKWFSTKKPFELTQNELIMITLFIFLTILIFLFVIFYFSKRKKWIITNQDLENEINEKTKKLLELSITDHLTGLYNRTKLDEIIIREINISSRTSFPFSLIIIDIDFFKEINDNFGHLVGDQVLIEFSQLLKQNLREIDFLGRWGGEEFLVIIPFSKENDTLIITKRMKESIQKHVFPKGIQRTASFGITKYRNHDDLNSIIQRADEALYEAKEKGRNRIIINN